MQVDYIIVGFGLAGLAFAENLEQHGKSFLVFEDQSQNSSQVAAGIYNPVILKRFTPVWDAVDQLRIAIPFYKNLETKLGIALDHKTDIFRVFKSVEEQNNWFNACDLSYFSDYMLPKVFKNDNSALVAPLGSGKLRHVGKIDVKKMIDTYIEYLQQKKCIRLESMNYEDIEVRGQKVAYHGIKAKKMIFCEGYGVKNNPYFMNLPLNGTKGELITIKAPNLNVDVIVKSAVFVLPMGNNVYKVGATFNWHDKTLNPTEEGKEELIDKLKKVLNCRFEVIEHDAGIRPTVKDRRPLLGKHQEYDQLAILNGFGTRGVMVAPKMAQILYDHLENDKELPKEIAISRFY